MAGSVQVVVRFNHLAGIAQSLRPRAAEEVERAARNIERDAKARVPVDTGTLRRSIHVEAPSQLSRVVGPNTPYARRIEYGFNGADARGRVYHQPGRPYLIPAAEAERPRFVERMKRALQP